MLCAIITVAYCSTSDNDKKKDKRGIFNFGLGYGGLGGGYATDFNHGIFDGGLGAPSFRAAPFYAGNQLLGLNTHTTITRKIGVPVPHPYPVPVEKHIPVPYKVKNGSFKY